MICDITMYLSSSYCYYDYDSDYMICDLVSCSFGYFYDYDDDFHFPSKHCSILATYYLSTNYHSLFQPIATYYYL